MPGPNAVGGPSRAPQQQPNVTPVAQRAPSLESQQDAVITEMDARTASTQRRRSVPQFARNVATALHRAGGSPSMAAASLTRGQVAEMAFRGRDELVQGFVAAGLSPGDASTMASEVARSVSTRIRMEVTSRGHEVIAERRTELVHARDTLRSFQNAPEGTGKAAVYASLVERFGEEGIAQMMESYDNGLEALDNWDRRLDGMAWELSELGDAARALAPEGWVRDGSIASEAIGRERLGSRTVESVQTAGELVHLGAEIGAAIVEASHGAGLLAGAEAIGGVFTVAAIYAHHVAQEKHENFVHGMQHLFEEAR